MTWAPQPGPQTAFVTSKVFDVCYGGARGGGKTDAALGEFAWHALSFGPAARGLLVRRARVALEPTIARARRVFGQNGAVWRDARSRFEWPNGAVLYFRYIDNDADADLYQGHDYARVYVQELTQFRSPAPIDKLKAVLRSAAGVRCAFRATCNPGGPGHNWVKARYIDAGAYRPVTETYRNPFTGAATTLTRTFIPARLTDNPALLARDPNYVARLQQAGSAALVKAWLEGDWSIVDGAFFDKWSARNIIKPFAAPFSVAWWAVASNTAALPDGAVVPHGALVRYREWYGCTGKADVGLRLEAEAVAAGIIERERGETVGYAVADPSIFRQDGGPSIGERMRRVGLAFRPADNTRVGVAGAMSGWDQMRARIAGDDTGPMLLVFDTCRDFIRTVPAVQHDPARHEDLDTRAEDHVADETRYACLSRPLIARDAPPEPSRGGWDWEGMRERDRCRWENNWKTM